MLSFIKNIFYSLLYKKINNDKNNLLIKNDENKELPSYNEIINKSSNNLISDNNTTHIDIYIQELQEKGYTIIPQVYNNQEIDNHWKEFNKWRENTENLDYYHSVVDFHGIFKYFQVGHQRFAWLARTNPKILNIFKKIWNTDELVCSFDGCCYYPKEINEEPSYWTHSDQSRQKKDLWCYQSFLSLTNNSERTLIVYEGTHKYHEHYFNTMNINNDSDWNIIDESYLETYHYDKFRILDVSAGDLVIWDSRLFHQNTCGTLSCDEERLVQYLCYLPKNRIGNDKMQQELRKQLFKNLRTTNHWPYPMAAVSEQPNAYNHYNPNNKKFINYDNILKPELDDLLPEIKKLL